EPAEVCDLVRDARFPGGAGQIETDFHTAFGEEIGVRNEQLGTRKLFHERSLEGIEFCLCERFSYDRVIAVGPRESGALQAQAPRVCGSLDLRQVTRIRNLLFKRAKWDPATCGAAKTEHPCDCSKHLSLLLIEQETYLSSCEA